jgi:hypothetical protein
MQPKQPYFYPPQWGGIMQRELGMPEQVPRPPSPLGVILIGAGLGLLAYRVLSAWGSGGPTRTCGLCGRPGHDRRTCSHGGPRLNLSSDLLKSRRCECCGCYRQGTQRHHTQGRASTWDYLDLCDACHLECGHEGDFRNLAIKPQFCRITDRPAFWRH